MHLKALEIHGFKSFPDKTLLPFDQNITAVVGPNGSGKSNILDAIRWVVGDQSPKNMRGTKMEDVIFGGTEKRKQTGYAQVSLILDNTSRLFPLEESEVMVTRKCYRSGGSDYFINKHSVTAKEITNLFLDTGIGKEGYAVIGQGRIDEILSVKSEQRRKVFEEAAGIARYRKSKEDAQSKLARTEENLLRIQDKISELELQVIPLKAQSETAKKFLIFRDELRVLEISLWLEQISQVQASKIKLSSDYQEASRQQSQVTQTLEDLYTKVEALGEEMRVKDIQIDGLRRELLGAEAGVTEQEATITVLKNKISNNENNAKRLEDSLSQKQERQSSLSAQIQQQVETLDTISQKRTTLTQNSQSLHVKHQETEQDLQTVSNLLKTLQQQETTHTQDLSDAKARLSALTSSTQEIFDQDEVLRQELAGLEARILQEKTNLSQEEASLQEAEEGKLSAQNTLSGYKLRLEGGQQKLQQQKAKQEELRIGLGNAQSKQKLLTDMERMYEGFDVGVKLVMQESQKGTLQNIYGPVAQLITVPQEFTVAIETALGGAMQNIVAHAPKDGKAIFSYLNQRKRGRVTVIPLTNMKGGYLSQKNALTQEAGFVGIANDLISFDPTFAPVFGNLLGRVVIMENWDTANAVAQKYQHQFRIVTLDGQVFNRGGTMTGGVAPRNAGILSRKEELNQLTKQVQQLQTQLDTLNQETQELTALVSADQYQLEVAQGELRTWEDTILQCQGKCTATAQGVEERSAQLASRQLQLVQLKDRSEKNQVSTQELQEELQRRQQQLSQLQEDIQEKKQSHETLQQSYITLNQQSSQYTAQLEALIHEEDTAKQALENLQTLLNDLSGEQEASTSLIQEYSSTNQTYLEEIRRKEVGILESQTQVQQLTQDVSRLTAEKNALEAQRNKTDRDSRDKNNELLTMEREVNTLAQKKELAELEETQILNTLWNTYKLGHPAAMQQRIEIESTAKATRRVEELKKDISDLGNINIDSIEEFERINQRYTYLFDQHADITQAKKELEQIITEIVAEMAEIFSTEFDKINQAFGEVFVQLFGGGQATVVLEAPEDVLETGIEIHAQPPGKALKVISLLSGGEKALVAIALYFAILRIRPTPFVVMDEIDAALDDSNIERFVNYVKKISDKTQFVIITHRRGSMEAADILYGITMQEKGVSRMLRLDINQVESELNLKL